MLMGDASRQVPLETIRRKGGSGYGATGGLRLRCLDGSGGKTTLLPVNMELAPSLLRRGRFAERANNPFSRKPRRNSPFHNEQLSHARNSVVSIGTHLGRLGLTIAGAFIAERPAMDHKADEYWGTLLLAMARDARQDGDLGTADLLFAEAMRYFDEADRLASRWRSFETRLDAEAPRR
jgi:hypothetical protein